MSLLCSAAQSNRAPSRALALPTSLQLLAFTHGQLDSSWGGADAQPGSCMGLGGDSHGVDPASEHALHSSICKVRVLPLLDVDQCCVMCISMNIMHHSGVACSF